MSDQSNLMRHEAGRSARHTQPHVGIVDSYRSDTHSIKVSHATETDEDGNPRLSGWIPHLSHAGGANGKHVVGPSIGDQAVIGYLDGNPNTPYVQGYLHNDIDQPPKVESGEARREFAGGKFVENVDASGNVIASHNGTKAVTGKGDITLDYSGHTVTIKGATIVLVSSDIRLGGTDASKPLAMQGTVDTGGFSDVSNLSTTVKTK